MDARKINHGFQFSGGSYTTLDVPSSADTQAFGINGSGQIVGSYNNFILRNCHRAMLPEMDPLCGEIEFVVPIEIQHRDRHQKAVASPRKKPLIWSRTSAVQSQYKYRNEGPTEWWVLAERGSVMLEAFGLWFLVAGFVPGTHGANFTWMPWAGKSSSSTRRTQPSHAPEAFTTLKTRTLVPCRSATGPAVSRPSSGPCRRH
jgi:hypothetical protein